jgi:phospholipase A-2-activating protein
MDTLQLGYLGELIEALRRTPSSKIRATDMELIRYLLKWPTEQLFPVIDLLRFFLLHPFSNELFKGSDRGLGQIVEALGWLKDVNTPVALCGMRFFANCFCYSTNLYSIVEKRDMLCQKFRNAGLVASTNKNTRLALATTLLNLASGTATFVKGSKDLAAVVDLAVELLAVEKEVEGRYRLVSCLGTAVVADAKCKPKVMSALGKLGAQLTGDPKLQAAAQELRMASQA